MATIENAAHPKAVANLAKHFAFTRCGELNLRGMVDAQITVLERELLAQSRVTTETFRIKLFHAEAAAAQEGKVKPGS